MSQKKIGMSQDLLQAMKMFTNSVNKSKAMKEETGVKEVVEAMKAQNLSVNQGNTNAPVTESISDPINTAYIISETNSASPETIQNQVASVVNPEPTT